MTYTDQPITCQNEACQATTYDAVDSTCGLTICQECEAEYKAQTTAPDGTPLPADGSPIN